MMITKKETCSNSDGPLIRVEGLTKRYSTSAGPITAVDDVSFEVDRGEIVGILGPNGAGKTTMIKSILGLVEPTAGRALINGVNPAEEPSEAYTQVSAILEGARNLYWRLTVRENLRYFTGLQGIHPDDVSEHHERLLSIVNLASKADERVRNLSRGMKQKACLVCVLARATPVVFLDEPTLGLDPEANEDLQDELRRLTREGERTILLSSHDMDVIESVCDRVLLFNDGSLVVDDALDSLLEVFATETYRIHLSEPAPELDSLADFDPRWTDGGRSCRVVISDETEFYRLTDTLESSPLSLERIEPVEQDLETVFLATVGERGDASLDGTRDLAAVTERDRE